MGAKFHGVLSLVLIFASVVMGLSYMLSGSPGWGLVYLGVIVLASPTVLYCYCAKCHCNEDACSHVIPGKLTRLLPARRPGPYSFRDYFGTAVALIALFGFPQLWLRQNPAIFILFWILLIVGLVEILAFVCRACMNANCPINQAELRP